MNPKKVTRADPGGARSGRRQDERGQATAEQVGLVALLAGLLVALVALAGPVASVVATTVERAMCSIPGAECAAEDSASGTAPPPGPAVGEPSSPPIEDGAAPDQPGTTPSLAPGSADAEPPGLGIPVDDLAALSPTDVQTALGPLSAGRQLELARTHPEVIGPLDGAPPAMRYEANRLLMQREIERLEALRRQLAGPDVPDWIREAAGERLAADIARYREWADPERQFLLFDPSGDGRAAEVFGDLVAADHVAVVVPGINNDIGNFDGFRANAQRLYREAELLAPPGERVATVAWLGYDTPEGVTAAVGGPAETGSRALSPFVTGITLDGKDTVTVVGHSYGSLVTGKALRDQGLRPDNAVFVGSPGTGVNDRDGLGSGFEVWAAKAPNDVVPFSPGHGEDPTADGFGARRFNTNGPGQADVSGHSSYFKARSEALRNMALIMTGQYDQVSGAS